MTVATLDEAVRPAVTFTVRIKRTPSGASRVVWNEATLDRVQGKVVRTVDGPATAPSPTTMAR